MLYHQEILYDFQDLWIGVSCEACLCIFGQPSHYNRLPLTIYALSNVSSKMNKLGSPSKETNLTYYNTPNYFCQHDHLCSNLSSLQVRTNNCNFLLSTKSVLTTNQIMPPQGLKYCSKPEYQSLTGMMCCAAMHQHVMRVV